MSVCVTIWCLISVGNLASLPLIVVPAICKEQNNPFGDEAVCHTKGLAYASLSMVGYTYVWSIAFNVFCLYLPMTPINEVKVDESTVKTMSEKETDPENLLKCSYEALVLAEDISKPNGGMDQPKIECKVANGQAQSVKIQKLQLETAGARREAEEMKRKAQELKQEAERARVVAEEA
ncbi:hypothetical protein Fmac_008546 [Flemingia macrophylla]|uniref:PIN-like protein n=1 Tax=Flemingia macrophylla TaxID=520843 RepID=A0ABD1MY83_9FABA